MCMLFRVLYVSILCLLCTISFIYFVKGPLKPILDFITDRSAMSTLTSEAKLRVAKNLLKRRHRFSVF